MGERDETEALPDDAATAAARAAETRGQLPRGTLVGRYVVIDVLGVGGMGVVYAAYDPELDRRLALKLVHAKGAGSANDTEARARLLREAQAMARLSHPNVVAVHDVGTFRDEVFVAMEFVEGTTLRGWLSEKRRAWREVLAIFAEAGRGLVAAHAAGLVHRDFKPENVLVGRDGRARVADFGLARATEPDESIDPAGSGAKSLAVPTLRRPLVTEAGVIMGTPVYMAPEQHRGRTTDARTDQFSFAVALYEALVGARPFEGENLADYSRNVVQGEMRVLPAMSQVPRRVLRALGRALAAKPDARWPSMEVFLHALTRTPLVTWRRVGVAAIVVGTAIGAMIGVEAAREQRAKLCRGGELEIALVWNDSRAAAISRAFLATGRPHVAEAWASARAAIDAYARDWSAMHREACEATRLRGEQSDAVLDLRMECLGNAKTGLGALATAFEHADTKVVENSARATQDLARLADCADVESLRRRVPPPDSTRRAAVDTIRGKLAEAKAHLDTAKYTKGVPIVREAIAEARDLGYRPVEAEARLLLGQLFYRLGKPVDAEDALVEAALVAEAGRHETVAARAFSLLVLVVGYERMVPDAGFRWGRFAEAILERLGGDPRIETDLANHRAVVHWSRGQHDEAERLHRSALAIRERVDGPGHIEVAFLLNNFVEVVRTQGKFVEALQMLERSLAIKRKILVTDHPSIALSVFNKGNIFYAWGRFSDALQHYKEALASFERVLDPWHTRVAMALGNTGAALDALERHAEALPLRVRELAINERALGADHPDTAISRAGLGGCLAELGRYREARAHLERARASVTTGAKVQPFFRATPLTLLGELSTLEGRHREAVTILDAAITANSAVVPREHWWNFRPLVGLGLAELGRGRREVASAALEHAIRTGERLGFSELKMAVPRFALARAVAHAPGSRARAVRLAEIARKAYAGAGVSFAKKRDEVEAWLTRIARE